MTADREILDTVLASVDRQAVVDLNELGELAAPEEDEPPLDDELLRLFYLEAMTLTEISAALEIPLGTVKSRLSYGLAALRSAWGSAR